MKIRISKSAGIAFVVMALVVYAYFRLFSAYVPTYGKGGVGTADYDNYVMTSGEVNSAICGTERWVGRSRSETETISCSSGRTAPFRVSDLGKATLIFHFTPTRIRIFDVKSLKGGYYLRKTDDDYPPTDVSLDSSPSH